jgi:hypothetical protein
MKAFTAFRLALFTHRTLVVQNKNGGLFKSPQVGTNIYRVVDVFGFDWVTGDKNILVFWWA